MCIEKEFSCRKFRLVSERLTNYFEGHSSYTYIWNLINLELATMNKTDHASFLKDIHIVEWLLFNFSHHHFIEMVKKQVPEYHNQSIQKMKVIEEVFYHKKATWNLRQWKFSLVPTTRISFLSKYFSLTSLKLLKIEEKKTLKF